MSFETCEAEGTQKELFKPADIFHKSSFLSAMTFPVHEDCVTFPQQPVTNRPHQPLSQSFAASSGLLIILTAVPEPLHSMSIPAEAPGVTCWGGPAPFTLPL